LKQICIVSICCFVIICIAPCSWPLFSQQCMRQQQHCTGVLAANLQQQQQQQQQQHGAFAGDL
jgi:hypothetical protein